MKAFLQTLLIAAVILIQTSSVNAQYTYQTAKRIANSSLISIPTDSNAILPPGIQTGCALITTQPVWFSLGFCADQSLFLDFNMYALGPAQMSIVIYGPFTDTLNLSSKLINANIDTCVNSLGGFNWVYYISNYQRGDIYMILMMTNTFTYNVKVTNNQAPIQMEYDSLYCQFCNSRLSELYQPVCTSIYDSSSQKNKLIWTKDIFTAAQDYVIFRKNVSNTYDTLAFQSVSQLSEYIDSTSSPQVKSYEYKLGIRDSCGQFTNKEDIGYYSIPTARTIHLMSYPTGSNSVGLTWNRGSFNGPFYIYRTDPSGVTTLIDSVGLIPDPQTYTDINAPAGFCSYQIGVNLNPPCVASVLPNTYTTVKSNPGYVTVTGINELVDLSKALSVEPNPFNQYTKIDLQHFNKQNLKVVLINLTGQTIAQYDNVKTDELIIERKNLSQGVYFLEVTGKDFYARKKLVVE